MVVIPCLHHVCHQDRCQHHILLLSASSTRPCCQRVELDGDGIGHVVVADDGIVTSVRHVVVVDRYVLIDCMLGSQLSIVAQYVGIAIVGSDRVPVVVVAVFFWVHLDVRTSWRQRR